MSPLLDVEAAAMTPPENAAFEWRLVCGCGHVYNFGSDEIAAGHLLAWKRRNDDEHGGARLERRPANWEAVNA